MTGLDARSPHEYRIATMKRRTAVLLVILAISGMQPVASRAVSTNNASVREVLAIDSERTKALLSNDAATLDRIMAPDVTYITGDGELNTRPELLADVRSRKLTYTRLQYSDTSARLFGNTAILVSRASVQGRYQSTLLKYNLRVTRVYVNRNRRWLLEAIQSTRTR